MVATEVAAVPRTVLDVAHDRSLHLPVMGRDNAAGKVRRIVRDGVRDVRDVRRRRSTPSIGPRARVPPESHNVPPALQSIARRLIGLIQAIQGARDQRSSAAGDGQGGSPSAYRPDSYIIP